MGRNRNLGLWSQLGVVVAALAASACCWLPLLLVAVGASSIGLAGALEPYRPLLIGVTVALLGTAFYLAYRRPRRVAREGESCCAAAGEARPASARRMTRVMLWPVAALAVAFLFFPQYVGLMAARPAVGADLERVVVHIDGMTCAGCAQVIRTALVRVEGVVQAAVHHDPGYAEIFVRPGSVPRERLEAAIEKAGYTVRRERKEAPPGEGR